MTIPTKQMAVLMLATALAKPLLASVEERSPAASGQVPAAGEPRLKDLPSTTTGKERLGNKWTDDQRMDNCKVPVEKRGEKPRPGECSH